MKDKKNRKDLEETVKEKVSPLLEQTMEKSWGITIPKLESDITDQLANPHLTVYVPFNLSFKNAKNLFKKEFMKKELQLHLGNVSELAQDLGLDRRSIHRVIKDLDIDIEKMRRHRQSESDYQEDLVKQTINSTLEQYKEIIHPEKMEKMYQEVPSLSRNIAKFLPRSQRTWKEAENDFEGKFLTHALEENDWHVLKTAEKIHLRQETLHRKIKKVGLKHKS